MADTDELLHIITQLTGRHVFPEDALREIVGTSDRNVEAFNLCDGTRAQAEVVKAAKIDQGTFSRRSARWIQEGVMFRLGTGRDVRLLHIYPLPERAQRPAKGIESTEA